LSGQLGPEKTLQSIPMFLEAYHRTLKRSGLYLDAKQNRRLDFLIYTRINMSQDYRRRMIVKEQNLSEMNFRVQLLNEQHRRSVLIDPSEITEKSGQWYVKARQANRFYSVKYVRILLNFTEY